MDSPLIDEEVRSTLSRARVLLTRGERDAALSLAEELAQKYPDSPEAKEALADVLIGVGRKRDAIRLLKEVIDQFPGRIETERRHANLVFGLHKHEWEQYAAALERDDGAFGKRSAGAATMLGLMFPGLGQLYVGQFWRGVVFAALAVFGFAVAFTIGRAENGMNGIGIGALVFLATLWITGILDAAASAARTSDVRPRGRPEPPSNLPFE
jgi:tetratricopeptide (TPR) repeat protein